MLMIKRGDPVACLGACEVCQQLSVSQRDFPGGSDGKEFASNAGNQNSFPGSGRSP